MRCPFPGMDPYLEHPSLWPDVHNSLIAAIRDGLVSLIAPRYYVSVEQRAYPFTFDDLALIGVVDVGIGRAERPGPRIGGEETAGTAAAVDVLVPTVEPIRQTFLELRDVASGTLVTAIELLSPANKIHAKGRKAYERKRQLIFDSQTNFVEIDLHRAGKPMPWTDRKPPSDYRIFVSRTETRPRAKLYPFSVRTAIPSIPIPLLPEDGAVDLDLNAVLHSLYARARYDLRLDYAKAPVPPLDEADQPWAADLIASARAEADLG